jgi:hypothetical protein
MSRGDRRSQRDRGEGKTCDHTSQLGSCSEQVEMGHFYTKNCLLLLAALHRCSIKFVFDPSHRRCAPVCPPVHGGTDEPSGSQGGEGAMRRSDAEFYVDTSAEHEPRNYLAIFLNFVVLSTGDE